MADREKSILLVANWDSGVGYVWWLMESYWVAIAKNRTNERVVIAYPTISELPREVADAPIDCVETDFSSKGLKDVLRQVRFIRRNAIGCIYFSDADMLHWRYVLFRLAGVRCIINHDHTPGERVASASWKKLAKAVLARLPLISVNAAFSATNYVYDRHLQVDRLPAHRCHVVMNGLPERRPSPPVDLQALYGIPPDRCVVVTTARAVRYKGVGFALACIASIVKAAAGTKPHYLFCGDGPDLETFKKLAAELQIYGFVSMPGYQENIPGLLAAADFAFHPSCGEVGYSISILEYMQAGLPVVVPDNPSVCGATRDRIDGLVYERENLVAAVSALRELINDENLRLSMGRAAMQAVTEDYSLAQGHSQLLDGINRYYPAEAGGG